MCEEPCHCREAKNEEESCCISGGQVRGFAQPWILLLLMQQPSHGYELLERFGHEDLPCVDPGMLYRMLRQLEAEGMVRSSWETLGGGPARRHYEVTDAGVELLHAWAAQVRATRHRLDRFLGDYAAQFEKAGAGAAAASVDRLKAR